MIRERERERKREGRERERERGERRTGRKREREGEREREKVRSVILQGSGVHTRGSETTQLFFLRDIGARRPGRQAVTESVR